MSRKLHISFLADLPAVALASNSRVGHPWRLDGFSSWVSTCMIEIFFARQLAQGTIWSAMGIVLVH
jgi:hypothetical protein